MGAYITSITLGMVIVFSLHDSGAVSSAKRTLSPVEDFVIGAILLLAGYVLRSRGEELSDLDLVALREQLHILDTEAGHLQDLKSDGITFMFHGRRPESDKPYIRKAV